MGKTGMRGIGLKTMRLKQQLNPFQDLPLFSVPLAEDDNVYPSACIYD
jgi:hypothetical protein